MCFNPETSLIAFGVSCISSVIVFCYSIKTKNHEIANIDFISAVLIFLIGSMQFLEYFMWSDQACIQKGPNWWASLAVLPVLYFQPVITFFVALWLAYPNLKKLVHYPFVFLFISGIVIASFTFVLFQNTRYLLKSDEKENEKKHKDKSILLPFCSRPEKYTKRLIWAPMKYLFIKQSEKSYAFLFFYFLVIFLCSFLVPSIWRHFPIRALVLPATFIAAAIYSILYSEKGVGHIGILSDIFDSTWCFLAVGFGITSVLHI